MAGNEALPLEDAPPKRHRLFAMVFLAILADFILLSVLEPGRFQLRFTARLATFIVATIVWMLIGWYLGRVAWPRLGKRLARYLLRRTLRAKVLPIVFLTDRHDFEFSMMKRLLEVLGFAAGSVTILSVVLTLTGAEGGFVLATTGLVLVFALFACFVLVPYWIFARMGLRRVDPIRWLVEPLSRRYADRLRLSNGALLLIAFGAVINLAFRAGASGNEALVIGIATVGHIVASVLVAAATALAVYVHDERKLVREVEREALAMGIADGRGMTDGDFLPQPPAARE